MPELPEVEILRRGIAPIFCITKLYAKSSDSTLLGGQSLKIYLTFLRVKQLPP